MEIILLGLKLKIVNFLNSLDSYNEAFLLCLKRTSETFHFQLKCLTRLKRNSVVMVHGVVNQ